MVTRIYDKKPNRQLMTCDRPPGYSFSVDLLKNFVLPCLLHVAFEIFSFLPLAFFIMKPKRRSCDLFGAPAPFSGSQLPTYREVGKAWRQSRLDLESENPGTKILNRQVAKHVIIQRI